MRTDILYGVVVVSENGGQNMNSFLKEESATSNANEIIEAIKKVKKKNMKVYMSQLEYDSYNNRLLTTCLIDEYSELLFQS